MDGEILVASDDEIAQPLVKRSKTTSANSGLDRLVITECRCQSRSCLTQFQHQQDAVSKLRGSFAVLEKLEKAA